MKSTTLIVKIPPTFMEVYGSWCNFLKGAEVRKSTRIRRLIKEDLEKNGISTNPE